MSNGLITFIIIIGSIGYLAMSAAVVILVYNYIKKMQMTATHSRYHTSLQRIGSSRASSSVTSQRHNSTLAGTSSTNTTPRHAPARSTELTLPSPPRTPSRNSTQPSELTETNTMIYFANDRHNSRDKEYRFKYKKVNGSWRAYILKMPSLGNRNSSASVTHRLYDNGNPYVCWNTPIESLKDMQNVSRIWADSIQEYIATGTKFGPQ